MNLVEAFRHNKPKRRSLASVEDQMSVLSLTCKPGKINKGEFKGIMGILGDGWHGIRQANGAWELQRTLGEEFPVRKLAIFIRANTIKVFDSQDEEPRLTIEDVDKIVLTKDSEKGSVMTVEKAYGLGRCILFLDQFLIRTEEVDDGRVQVIKNYPLLFSGE